MVVTDVHAYASPFPDVFAGHSMCRRISADSSESEREPTKYYEIETTTPGRVQPSNDARRVRRQSDAGDAHINNGSLYPMITIRLNASLGQI